jgi:hypothetical protein
MPDAVKKRSLSPEMIAAISAVVIGVCAIAVSLYETTLIRQQLKGSVWPNVEVGFSYNEAGFRYFLSNTGVGPARRGLARLPPLARRRSPHVRIGAPMDQE